MRASNLLLATLKETPADAEIVSHRLMLRAGMIRKVAAGIYNLLPLGLRVVRKIEQIAFTGIDARLATLLLDLDDRGVETVTHQYLAVELGTAREVVSRHLKRFENAGWVRLGRGRITLTDREQLELMTAPALGD